jgi:flagellar biosynthesis protein FliQ
MEGTFIAAAREALVVAVMISAPALLAALTLGLTISVFQALTQVQEQTLGVLARIFAVFATVYFLGYWMLTQLTRLGHKLFTEFPNWVR